MDQKEDFNGGTNKDKGKFKLIQEKISALVTSRMEDFETKRQEFLQFWRPLSVEFVNYVKRTYLDDDGIHPPQFWASCFFKDHPNIDFTNNEAERFHKEMNSLVHTKKPTIGQCIKILQKIELKSRIECNFEMNHSDYQYIIDEENGIAVPVSQSSKANLLMITRPSSSIVGDENIDVPAAKRAKRLAAVKEKENKKVDEREEECHI